MTTFPHELAGLPVGGPASLPAVKVQLSIPADDARDDDRLNPIITAVNSAVRRWRSAAIAVGEASWPEDYALGANMLVARLYKRRNSPAGVEVMGTLGAAYVMRNDPDIAMLLRVGTHAGPQLG